MIAPFVLVDHYSQQMQRAIDACAPDDVARTALAEAQARVAQLDGENEALRNTVAQLQHDLDHLRVQAVSHLVEMNRDAPASVERPSANVVALHGSPQR